MEIQEILDEVDALLAHNQGEQAEKLMLESASRAAKEQDDGALLQLLNELLGYYRESSRVEDADSIAAQAVALAERMGLNGTLPYATTLLNVANACRAGGKFEESLKYYRRVQELYGQLFDSDNMLTASLMNNLSLLYQETGKFESARDCLMKALDICLSNKAAYETAVTYANLASTCLQLDSRSEAHEYALKAIKLFEEQGVGDSHYAAALTALGTCHFQEKQYQKALSCYTRSMDIIRNSLGENQAFLRLEEYADACRKALDGNVAQDGGETESVNGLSLCREYYEKYGKSMIREKFAGYEDRIAAGLVGRGSDCFGYDDDLSRDHDWGPGFCLWVTDETYDEIGEELSRAYLELPGEFNGIERAPEVNGRGRRGVWRIKDFYESLVGAERYEDIDFRQAPDHGLAAAVNGEVFDDAEGIFTDFRNRLMEGYPAEIRYLKLAEAAASFSQCAQYNYGRMMKRGDTLTASMMLSDGIKAAMKLEHYILGIYPPHDKWLFRSLVKNGAGQETVRLLEALADASDQNETERLIEALGSALAMELYRCDLISDIEPYLDAHSQELVYKASLASKTREELAQEIAAEEFKAFDKVRNEGGRASCQDDWPTFSIMRKSQYLTWDKVMLMQYLYDFNREYSMGHNLIEEKYARMMESTAPAKYGELKERLPELGGEKKAIIEQICGLQVSWMEEFAREYPALAANSRNIHTYEDSSFDTSYETYLRGELGTYSDKMLELYGRYIVEHANEGKNVAREIMENSVRMYGYHSMEEAEEKNASAIHG